MKELRYTSQFKKDNQSPRLMHLHWPGRLAFKIGFQKPRNSASHHDRQET